MQSKALKNFSYDSNTLDKKIIFVTGATDGIGKALSIQLAKSGAKVILHGRNKKKLELIYDEINKMEDCTEPSIALLDFESSAIESYSSLTNSILDNFNYLDGLVHCAGILGDKTPIEQYNPEVWQKVMHVNLTAPFVLTQALLPCLKLSNNPSIIFTSSGVGKIGKAFWGAYSASKFGTEALSQILANETKHTSLRVNCVNPGAVRTKMRLAAYPAEKKDNLKLPNEILLPYIFLLSDTSIGITGESLEAQ
jgi:NAD(P)-dependent dehydrogenase (short-subunit alcohol dehydrogenase family)